MPASQPANFNLQEFTDVGQPLVGGRLYTYAYGTTAQKIAFTDPDGAVPQTYTADGTGGQYIALNARGELPAPLYLGVGSYDISLKRADGSTVWTRKADGVDNLANAAVAELAAPSGAGMLGYQAAAANAVAMWASEKLGETVSVRDFMTPNQRNNVFGRVGTMDVSGAIQAAINSLGANGGQVLLPPGVYFSSATVKINGQSNIHLRGAKFSGSWTTSTLGTTIKAASSSQDVFSFSNYSYNCTVEGLHITGGARALHFDTCLGWHVYSCNLRENATGLECYGNGVGVVRDCMIRDNTVAGIYLAKSSGDTELCNLDVGGNKANLIISTGGVKIFGGSYFSSKQPDGSGVGIKIDRTTVSADAVIRNVKVFGALIGNNDTAIIINGTSLAQRDVADVKFFGCHIHQDNNGGAGFDNTFANGYGALVQNVLTGVSFIDCDIIGMRGYAIKAVNCLDGIVVRGGSIRSGNGDGLVFDLVQKARVRDVEFNSNAGTAVKMTCTNTGDYTQNNRIADCNYWGNGIGITEDARCRANMYEDPFGITLGDITLSGTLPLSQIRISQQAGNQLSLKNQMLYVDTVAGSAWNGAHLTVGSDHLWPDSTGKWRTKHGAAPTSDIDGTVVGSQA